MGRKSKSTCARLANLLKAPAKIYKATVEECSDVEDPPYKPGPDDNVWDLAMVSDSSDGRQCLDNSEARAFYIAFDNNKTWIRNLMRMALSLMKQIFLMMLSYSPFQMFWPMHKQLQLKLRKGLTH